MIEFISKPKVTYPRPTSTRISMSLNLSNSSLYNVQNTQTQSKHRENIIFVFCLFLLLYVPSQQLWSLRDGQFIWPHFFLGKLEQAVNQYFVHILSLVTDNNPSWMIQRKEEKKLFHDQSPRKYGTGPGSNWRPLDLQSDSHLLPDTLPTALRGPVMKHNK